jgi:ABC-2 type transport system permease protein
MTVFRYSLRQLRVHIVSYGIGLGLYAALIAMLFPAMRETLDQLTETYPKEILDAFGLAEISLADPRGFLSAEFFSFAPVIFGVFAVFTATGALAGEESAGTMELLAALPMSRRALFFYKVAAIALAATAIAALTSVGWIVTVPFVDMGDLPLSTVVAATFGQLSFVAFMVAVGLLLAAIAPSRGTAAAWTAVVLVVAYLLVVIASVAEPVSWLQYASPYYYSHQADILTSGVVVSHLIGLLVVTLATGALALFAFERREFGGERWQIPAPAPRTRSSQPT